MLLGVLVNQLLPDPNLFIASVDSDVGRVATSTYALLDIK